MYVYIVFLTMSKLCGHARSFNYYTTGKSHVFLTTELDRWFFVRMFECYYINAASGLHSIFLPIELLFIHLMPLLDTYFTLPKSSAAFNRAPNKIFQDDLECLVAHRDFLAAFKVQMIFHEFLGECQVSEVIFENYTRVLCFSLYDVYVLGITSLT